MILLMVGLLIGGRIMSRDKDDPEMQKLGRIGTRLGLIMLLLMILAILVRFGRYWLL